MFTLEVLNPNAQTEGDVKATGAAVRPKSLDGLTLGLIWNGKRGGEIALRKAGDVLKDKYKDLNVIFYNGTQPCEKKLIKEAIDKCDVFIGSTGD